MQELEVRVNKLELFSKKLAGGQNDLYGALQEFSGLVADEIRQQIKQEAAGIGITIREEAGKELTEVKIKQEEIAEKLKETGIDRHKQADIQNKLLSRTYQLTGKNGTKEYILFYKPVKGRITKLLKQKYKISSYKDISIDEYDAAMNDIDTLSVEPWFIQYIVDDWKRKSKDGEIKVSEQRALNEYLGKN